MTRPETPSFTEFCRFLKDGGLYCDTHWAPQVDLMLLPLADFDLIGKVETLHDDLNVLLDKMGREPTVKEPPWRNQTDP